jgi:hypothetical protein
MLYAAGEHANLLGRALSVTLSPAVDALFPASNLGDGRPTRPAKHGSNAANPSVTFDTAAFTPQGAGTVTIVVRSGERRRITSTGTTSISIQNLSTGKYLTTGSAWQAGATSCLTSAGSRDYQVESFSLCQAALVLLKIVITSGTGVWDQPRWNALGVIGHNLDPGLTCEMRSSSDNFSGSNVLEVTGSILQPAFYFYDGTAGITNRYGRLLHTGTNQATPWYGEIFPCWLESSVDRPDVGMEIQYEEPQVRNAGPLGDTHVYNLAPWPRRIARMQFDQLATTGAIETRQEIILRCRGGAYPILLVPVESEPMVIHGRPTEKWSETRFISTRWRNDLVIAEDAIAAPLV